MDRRSLPLLMLVATAGCGGAGQQSPTPLAPVDSRSGTANGLNGGANPEAVYKPVLGLNSPLGPLKPLAERSALAKVPEGKVDKDGAAKLAKLGKEPVKFDDAYGYIVADATSPRATVGEKGATVPLPAEAKTNPDGSVWVVDAETRRVFTLTGVKREGDKPAVVGAETNYDLVHPTADAPVPDLALLARADEATTEIHHALRISAKGVGTEGAAPAGARIRLKKGSSEKDATLLAKSVFRALKKYGAVLASGTGEPALSAMADPRWTKEDEKSLGVLHMTDFEIVSAPSKPVNVAKKSL